MKRSTQLLLFGLIAFGLANVGLLYQCFQYKVIASNEASLRQRAEWTISDGIRNVGVNVYQDSITTGHHLILRYDATTCLTCIAKAEALLVEVFGEEYLMRELCCIGEFGQVEPSKDIAFVQTHERVTPMDDVYTPYFCVVGDDGNVLFSLSLIPDNCDYNRKILVKLKKALDDNQGD